MCPSVTLYTTDPTWSEPGMKRVLHGRWPVSNHLSHGTALQVLYDYV
jgi:hypothetical protein